MKTLLTIYKENASRRPLFNEIIDIDFYDGPTEAICQLIDSEQWIVCSLVYIDFGKRERIFTMLEIGDELLSKFKSILVKKTKGDQAALYEQLKAQVKDVYNSYSSEVFLLKSDWLTSTEYSVVEIPLKYLQYFEDNEGVIEQSEESKLKWLSFFSPSK